MRSSIKTLAQKIFWPQMVGTSNNSFNLIKAVGRAGIQRALDIFGDDGVARRIRMKNVQQHIKDASRVADRQTDRVISRKSLSIKDIDTHLRAHGSHMSPPAVVDLMLHCGKRGITLGHDHVRVLNSRIKRGGTAALTTTQVSKIFRAIAFLRSDVTEVRLLLVTLQHLLSSAPIESYDTAVFVGIFNGLRSMSCEYVEVSDLVSFLAYRLELLTSPTYTGHIIFSADDISHMLYGCKGLSNSYLSVAHLWRVITHVISICPDSFSAIQVARCLHGLSSSELNKQVSSQVGQNEVRGLLVALEDAVQHSPMKWTSFELGMAFYGFKGICSYYPEVQNMYKLLLPRLDRCVDKFSPESLSSIFYGLKSSTGESTVESQILQALRAKLQQSELLSVGAIGVSMLGLQNMTESNRMMLKNIKTLATLLEKHPLPVAGGSRGTNNETNAEISTPNMEGRLTANTLYALRNKSADCREVRKMLKRVNDRLYFASMDVDTLTMAIYGMNNMSSRWTRVQVLLVELSRKLEASVATPAGCSDSLTAINSTGQRSGVWRGQNIGNVLYGLRRMSSKHSEVLIFVSAFTKCIESSVGPLSAQEMCNALYGLQGLSSEHVAVQRLLQALLPVIDRSTKVIDVRSRGDYSNSSAPHTSFREHMIGIGTTNRGGVDTITTTQSDSIMESTPVATVETDTVPTTADPDDKSWKRIIVKVGGPVTPQSAANAVFGFRNMRYGDTGVSGLLFFVRHAVMHDDPLRQPMNALEISMAMLGIGNMPTICRQSVHILRKLTNQIRHCEEEFSAQNIATCFNALRNKTPSPLTVDALYELSLKLRTVKGLDGSTISNLLQGLRCMTNSRVEVEEVLRLVSYKIDHCEYEFTGQDIAGSFSGIARMSIKSTPNDPLRLLVYALCFKIHSLSGSMTPSQLTTTLRSLSHLSRSSCREVSLLYRELARQVDKCETMFSTEQLEYCFIGLRSMHKCTSGPASTGSTRYNDNSSGDSMGDSGGENIDYDCGNISHSSGPDHGKDVIESSSLGMLLDALHRQELKTMSLYNCESGNRGGKGDRFGHRVYSGDVGGGNDSESEDA